MNRRRKTGPVEDLLDALALFPWWVGVALAGLLYLALHLVAQPPPPHGNGVPPDASELAMAAMTQGLAGAGQYVVPLACLAAAAASAWRRRSRRLQGAAQAPAEELLQGLNRPDFDALLAEAFRLCGYRVIETGRAADDDSGVDLVLHKAGGIELVWCKAWKLPRVGLEAVQALYEAMAVRGASGGWLVTAGRFTDEAVQFAGGRKLRLVDGVQLKTMLERAAIARQDRPVAPDMADTVPAWPRREP